MRRPIGAATTIELARCGLKQIASKVSGPSQVAETLALGLVRLRESREVREALADVRARGRRPLA